MALTGMWPYWVALGTTVGRATPSAMLELSLYQIFKADLNFREFYKPAFKLLVAKKQLFGVIAPQKSAFFFPPQKNSLLAQFWQIHKG